MPKLAEINGPRDDFLMRFLGETVTTGKQTHAQNSDQNQVYQTLARALVLAFGVDDPLHNDRPDERFYDIAFNAIPSAADMPDLPPDQEKKRDAVIAELVDTVKNFYKRKRHQTRAGGKQALLDMKHIQRVVDAFAPAPLPPKDLDVYQKYFKNRFLSAFEEVWKEKEKAAEGNETLLAQLRRTQGGQERAFAAERLGKETPQTKQEVAKKKEELHAQRLKDYRKLWGAPLDKPVNSRAWIMPEASAFLQAFLSWFATRYGVALVLNIAGGKDNSLPEAYSLFAAGQCKPGAAPLEDYVAHTTAETKVTMCQFVRDLMTGQFATTQPLPLPDAHKEEEDDAISSTLAKELELNPMRLIGKDEAGEWQVGGGDDVGNMINASGGGQSEGRFVGNGKAADTGLLSSHNDSGSTRRGDGNETQDMAVIPGTARNTSTTMRTSVKGKEVDRSRMVQAWVTGSGGEEAGNPSASGPVLGGREWDGNISDGSVGSEGQLRRRAGQETRKPPGSPEILGLSQTSVYRRVPGEAPGTEAADDDEEFAQALWTNIADAFANIEDGADGHPVDRERTLSLPPRTSTPETSSSVYAARRAALSQTPSIQSDFDVTPNVTRTRQGSERSAPPSEGPDDSDIEMADAYVSGLWKDRRQAKTKQKAPRKLLLGAIKRSRVGESRKIQKLPPKIGDKQPTGAETSSKPAEAPALPAKSIGASSEGSGQRGRAIQRMRAQTAGDGGRTVFSRSPVARKKRTRRVSSPEEIDRISNDGDGDGETQMGPVGGSTGLMDVDDEEQRTQTWIAEHGVEGCNSEGEGAWRTYLSKSVGMPRRSRIASAILDLPPAMRPVYADLVDTMEALLKGDKVWDIGAGGQLDNRKRPMLVSAITTKRGAHLPEGVPDGWGSGMIAWWRSLQPTQRGAEQAVRDLAPPSMEMGWGTLGEASGYKGPFLLVWCMMYWAQNGNDMDGWRIVAEDMISVFKVLLTVRGGRSREAETQQAAGEVSQGERARKRVRTAKDSGKDAGDMAPTGDIAQGKKSSRNAGRSRR
ncbi:unnamed protein product [Peniophora sp. CBMAI 1063]|nr:unnamed protein product [Peniophora sp. CBMAI 1063]